MMIDRKPHVHAALIKAWADGAKIEYQHTNGPWFYTRYPWWGEGIVFRIKPEPHKWQKEMDAYAAGRKIQCRSHNLHEWVVLTVTPAWFVGDGWEYRIAPEQVMRYSCVDLRGSENVLYHVTRNSPQDPGASKSNLKLTFEDGKLVDATVLK